MTDITKCSGNGCPKQEICHRYTCPSSTYQSYMDSKECLKSNFSLFWPCKTLTEFPKKEIIAQ